MVIQQYEIFLINLDTTIGHEIKKSRPCIVLSPDEMNQYIGTVIIALMTTQSKSYPTRVELSFQGKKGYIVLDPIRTVDKSRFIKKPGSPEKKTILKIKKVVQEMLVD